METKSFFRFCLALFILLEGSLVARAQEFNAIQLPQPNMTGGKPLMEVLKERQSSREFSTEKLPMQVMSDLLWAAFGINRPDLGKRTAPSAMNRQEVDIYVTTADGLYLYDAEACALQPILKEDIRAKCGKQEFVAVAPVNLVYVADFAKMGESSDDDKKIYTAADVGFIAENVYLFCASEGLATVVRGMVDREELAKTMSLRPEQHIILAQTVGYPKK
jgi:SagB-type dehydrogenase family enzyme